MNRLPDNHPLRAELAQARAKASGLTFDQAPELFKDIEAVKVRIAEWGRRQNRTKAHGAPE